MFKFHTFQFLSLVEPFVSRKLGSHHYGDVSWVFYVNDERPARCSRRPADSADLQKHTLQDEHAAPFVRAYRLLVSAFTAGFGVVKLSCVYSELDATVNAVEWAVILLLVPISSFYSSAVFVLGG